MTKLEQPGTDPEFDVVAADDLPHITRGRTKSLPSEEDIARRDHYVSALLTMQVVRPRAVYATDKEAKSALGKLLRLIATNPMPLEQYRIATRMMPANEAGEFGFVLFLRPKPTTPTSEIASES